MLYKDDLDLFLVTEHALWYVKFKEFDKIKIHENELSQKIIAGKVIRKRGKEMKFDEEMNLHKELMHEELGLDKAMKELMTEERKHFMKMLLAEESKMELGEEMELAEEMQFHEEINLGMNLKHSEVIKLLEELKRCEEFTLRQEIKGDLPRGPVLVDSKWYFVGSQRVMRKDINGFDTWTNLNVATLTASDLCFQNFPCLESPSLEGGARSKRIDPIVVPIGQEIFVLEKRPFFDYKGTAFPKTPIFQVFDTVSQSWSNLTPPPFYNPGSSNGMSSHYISSYFSWGKRLAISTFASGSFIYEVEEKEWKNVLDILRPGYIAFSCAIELEGFLIGMPFDQQLLVACKLDGNGLPMSQYQVLETLEDDLFYRPLQKPSSGFLTHFSKDNHIFFMYDGLDGYNRWVARIAVFQVFIPKGAADNLVVTVKKLHRYDLGPLNSFELTSRGDRISCQPNIYSAFFM